MVSTTKMRIEVLTFTIERVTHSLFDVIAWTSFTGWRMMMHGTWFRVTCSSSFLLPTSAWGGTGGPIAPFVPPCWISEKLIKKLWLECKDILKWSWERSSFEIYIYIIYVYTFFILTLTNKLSIFSSLSSQDCIYTPS